MTISDFKQLFKQKLDSFYEKNEIERFFKIVMEHFLQLTPTDLVLYNNNEIEKNKIGDLEDSIRLLQKSTPIQYITGSTYFYNSAIIVTPDTLIPRPETEELVDWIISDYKNTSQPLHILDIGTGSGCIAISLAKALPNAEVTAIDFSEKALKITKINAVENKVKIELIEKDILKTKLLEKHYDIIVSNPPYVRELEKKEIKANVLNFEPKEALFVTNNNPLIFYSKISDLAFQHLKSNGSLYFEINQYLGNKTLKLIRNTGFTKVELRKDFMKNERMIKAQL